MKKTLNIWQIAGFFFTMIAGVLLHYLFDWTGKSMFVAPFSAINESVWEHIKLVFFPMLIFALVENRYIRNQYKNFWCVKLIGFVTGIILIPVLYYTINGIFGSTPDWVNIAIFVVSAAAGFYAEVKSFVKNYVICKTPTAAMIIILLIVAVFVTFTFVPPHIPLFQALNINIGYSGFLLS